MSGSALRCEPDLRNLDVRVFRGGFDEKDQEVFFLTPRGVQMKEEDFYRLIDGSRMKWLEKQIRLDPR
ncbi:MAG: hypothetical protein NT028_07290 [candidate division Zixibacteria bacterium]|nr:hypothetical protein [candidate division Zixibacteria bacterium]